MQKYIAKPDEFVSDEYRMFSGQEEAIQRRYKMYKGKSGLIWLVADQKNAAENVYVTNNPENTSNKDSRWAGFGGASLRMPLVGGGEFILNGGWHSNSDALFNDTGVDVRDTYTTFVVLSKILDFTNDGTYRRIFRDIVYKDEKPTLGRYDRYKDLIKQYPEAKFYYMASRGGGSSGPV
jgi:hypothetical protein